MQHFTLIILLRLVYYSRYSKFSIIRLWRPSLWESIVPYIACKMIPVTSQTWSPFGYAFSLSICTSSSFLYSTQGSILLQVLHFSNVWLAFRLQCNTPVCPVYMLCALEITTCIRRFCLLALWNLELHNFSVEVMKLVLNKSFQLTNNPLWPIPFLV